MEFAYLSASTYPLISRSLDEALQVVQDAGFDHVDILGRKPHFSLGPECDPADVKATAAKHDLKIANLATYAASGWAKEEEGAPEQAWDEIVRIIDIAADFGADGIRVFNFRSPADKVEAMPKIVPWLKKAAEYAGGKGVKIGIESHHGGISRSPQTLRQLCDEVGSPNFGVIYDPANLISAEADYLGGIELLNEYIVHVHIKDGTRTFGSPRETMLGEGEVDIKGVLQRLEKIGYKGGLALEYENEKVPVDEGLKIWKQRFDEILAAV